MNGGWRPAVTGILVVAVMAVTASAQTFIEDRPAVQRALDIKRAPAGMFVQLKEVPLKDSSLDAARAAETPVPGFARAYSTPGRFAYRVDGFAVTRPLRSAAGAQSSAYTPLTGAGYAKFWAWNTFGPRASIGSALGAAWGTWVLNSPEEWDVGWEGMGKRFGASLADNAINTTSLTLISVATRQDPNYYRCPCTGFGSRLGHVLKMSLAGRNRQGDLVMSPGKLISPFIGPLVTRNTIYPARYDSRDAAISGLYGIGVAAGWNFVREFIWKARPW